MPSFSNLQQLDLFLYSFFFYILYEINNDHFTVTNLFKETISLFIFYYKYSLRLEFIKK